MLIRFSADVAQKATIDREKSGIMGSVAGAVEKTTGGVGERLRKNVRYFNANGAENQSSDAIFAEILTFY